jgi:catalase
MAPGAIDSTQHTADGERNGDIHRNYIDDRNAKAQDTLYATSNGVPMPHPYETQRVGENGPLLLQDHHLIDLISHFDRERIPERVVHAKGGGAHGFYRTTDGLDDICLADIFQQGHECPITVRFSTVGGESGTPDLARDPRGFSVKFRTAEGNWDVVANSTFHCNLSRSFTITDLVQTHLSSSFATPPSSLTSSTPRSVTRKPTSPTPMTPLSSGTTSPKTRSLSTRS